VGVSPRRLRTADGGSVSGCGHPRLLLARRARALLVPWETTSLPSYPSQTHPRGNLSREIFRSPALFSRSWTIAMINGATIQHPDACGAVGAVAPVFAVGLTTDRRGSHPLVVGKIPAVGAPICRALAAGVGTCRGLANWERNPRELLRSQPALRRK